MTATLNKGMNTLSLINLIIYLDLMHQRTEANMKLSYIFNKTNEKGFFVTRYVKDHTPGAAVKSVRETEETRSRLPQGLWAGVLERN